MTGGSTPQRRPSTAFKAWLADPYYNPTSTAVQALCPGGGGDGPVGTGTSSTTLPNGFTITGTPAGTKAVQYALAQLGKPYAWGGAGPDSYDCSGLTKAAWADSRGHPGPRHRRAGQRRHPRADGPVPGPSR